MQYRIDPGWIMVLRKGRPPMQGQFFGDKAWNVSFSLDLVCPSGAGEWKNRCTPGWREHAGSKPQLARICPLLQDELLGTEEPAQNWFLFTTDKKQDSLPCASVSPFSQPSSAFFI